MKKHITLAIISFLLCAIIAGFTGSVVLIEFAISTHPSGGAARFGILTCMILIISLLGAVTLPMIFMIQGLATKLNNSSLKRQDGSDM